MIHLLALYLFSLRRDFVLLALAGFCAFSFEKQMLVPFVWSAQMALVDAVADTKVPHYWIVSTLLSLALYAHQVQFGTVSFRTVRYFLHIRKNWMTHMYRVLCEWCLYSMPVLVNLCYVLLVGVSLHWVEAENWPLTWNLLNSFFIVVSSSYVLVYVRRLPRKYWPIWIVVIAEHLKSYFLQVPVSYCFLAFTLFLPELLNFDFLRKLKRYKRFVQQAVFVVILIAWLGTLLFTYDSTWLNWILFRVFQGPVSTLLGLYTTRAYTSNEGRAAMSNLSAKAVELIASLGQNQLMSGNRR